MPSVSTTTIMSKNTPIGMGLGKKEVVRKTGNRVVQDTYIVDNKYSGDNIFCVCCPYGTLTDEDVSGENEVELTQQYPQFARQIHSLLENRRAYIAEQRAIKSEQSANESANKQSCSIV